MNHIRSELLFYAKGNLVRIVGGSLRGRKLASLTGLAIRPTADRIREALFNILGSRPVGACVLDLFSGTGALGIEALSRGARQAVFVDNAAAALKILHKNIAACKLETSCKIFRWDILKNLNVLQPFQGAFDLVFMDPPYHRNMIGPTLAHLAGSHILAPQALVIVEYEAGEPLEPPGPVWLETDRRRYGRTEITFLRTHQD